MECLVRSFTVFPCIWYRKLLFINILQLKLHSFFYIEFLSLSFSFNIYILDYFSLVSDVLNWKWFLMDLFLDNCN